MASEGEGLAEEVREMAEEAAGDQNKVLVLPGNAHAQAIFETDQGDNLTQDISRATAEVPVGGGVTPVGFCALQ